MLPEVREAHDQHPLLHARHRLTAGKHLTLDQVQVHLLQCSGADGLHLVVQQQVHEGLGQVLTAGHTGHHGQLAWQVGEALEHCFKECYQVHQPL